MSRSPRRERTIRDGVTLVEVVMSTLLVGVLMTAALRSVGAAARSWVAAAEAADSHALAQQLLAEIVRQAYADPNQTALFGVETGESPTAGVRSGLDDLDDYNNWIDSPPKDPGGTPIVGYTGWQRTADVQKVDPAGYAVLPDASSDVGMRLITVTVVSPSARTTQLRAYRTLQGGCLQQQGVQQSLVTWVGSTLQVDGATAVTGGAALTNHAADQ